MFEPDVILKLELCVDHIIAIEKYFSNIKNADDLFMIDDGVYYDAVLMRLQALSEMLKKINNLYPKVIDALQYDEINDLIKFRDLVSHHYEKLKYEIIYNICVIDLPILKNSIIEKISF